MFMTGCSETFRSSQPTSGTPTPGVIQVIISVGAMGQGPAAYGANPLTIKAGSTVIWTNVDTMIHTVTSDIGVFESGNLTHGQKYSFQFKAAGSYSYHCTVHGGASMSGVIVVQ